MEKVSDPVFTGVKKDWVVSMDTLGQDRGIAEENRKWVGEWVEFVAKCVEETEKKQVAEVK